MMKAGWILVCVSVFLTIGALGQQGVYYLTGNIRETRGVVITDQGEKETLFNGMVGFKVMPSDKGTQLVLVELSLVSKGASTSRGHTGTLGLNLIDDDIAWYDARLRSGSFSPRMVLHYALIDRIKGFQTLGTKGEDDAFIPFTEGMAGKLTLRFPEGLQVQDKGSTTAEMELSFDLSSSLLGLVKRISLFFRVFLEWARLLSPALVLKVQPVFIGSGPGDLARTGASWDTLMYYARVLWSRCGSVRCITFSVNPPIYLNKPAYKVLETRDEEVALLGEVDVVDAVEVFVVSRMDYVCRTGGGACYSPGTASAKIVTCDQQLLVPRPCPCPDYCPSTCPPCPPCQTGRVNLYHLAHEIGHVLNLAHPPGPSGSLAASTPGSNMEPSGFCCDNPAVQSAKNCRNFSNPLLYWGSAVCSGSPDIRD